MVTYIVQTSEVSQRIEEELSHFGDVSLVSSRIKVYSLEMNPDFIPLVESLSFVERIEEDRLGTFDV